MPVNMADWYWTVNGDTTKVYSSRVGDYIPVSDSSYVTWLSMDNVPTRIASEEELGEVLANASVRPANANVLDSYKDKQARRLTIEIVAKILLWCVNEIRQLKGQQPVNAAQFRTFIKDQM